MTPHSRIFSLAPRYYSTLRRQNYVTPHSRIFSLAPRYYSTLRRQNYMTPHSRIFSLAPRYYSTLRRQNYVTPTSYLELILTFKTLLDLKRQEIMSLKQRYVTGLEKLEFAASQVSVMQQELTDLQPELIKTSAETEKLMIKIEQDTVEVEAKKEVCAWAAGSASILSGGYTLETPPKRGGGGGVNSVLRLLVLPHACHRATPLRPRSNEDRSGGGKGLSSHRLSRIVLKDDENA